MIYTWIFGAVFDLMGKKKDKGNVGPAGWAPQTDVVLDDPTNDTFTFISKKEETFENASIPIYLPHEIDEDEKKGRYKLIFF